MFFMTKPYTNPEKIQTSISLQNQELGPKGSKKQINRRMFLRLVEKFDGAFLAMYGVTMRQDRAEEVAKFLAAKAITMRCIWLRVA